MFDQSDIESARRMFENGVLPSAILRHFALAKPEAAVPHLTKLLRDALSLDFEDTLCVGGWWHDGTGELSDEEIDKFLLRAAQKKKA